MVQLLEGFLVYNKQIDAWSHAETGIGAGALDREETLLYAADTMAS